jgi:hypothetical protein
MDKLIRVVIFGPDRAAMDSYWFKSYEFQKASRLLIGVTDGGQRIVISLGDGYTLVVTEPRKADG